MFIAAVNLGTEDRILHGFLAMGTSRPAGQPGNSGPGRGKTHGLQIKDLCFHG